MTAAIPGGDVPRAWRGRDVGAWAGELGVPSLELTGILPSTNDRLRDLALSGAKPFATVIAGAQSRGRGRGGKGWHSPPDSGLWISILLGGEGGAPGVLPLAVGVAAARALEHFSAVPVALKWPNDLLVGGRKMAGILCEATGDGREGIVVGIGVNLRRTSLTIPDELVESMAFLEEVSGAEIPEPSLARILLSELRRWTHPTPSSLDGRLRAEWERRDILRGQPVRVESGLEGVALGVSNDGSLAVAESGGRVAQVRSGSVRLVLGDGSAAVRAFDRKLTSPGVE
jgi:BirA family biotin operon repressor/biotin-[acetyl-CoA-carboxylase] ligase